MDASTENSNHDNECIPKKENSDTPPNNSESSNKAEPVPPETEKKPSEILTKTIQNNIHGKNVAADTNVEGDQYKLEGDLHKFDNNKFFFYLGNEIIKDYSDKFERSQGHSSAEIISYKLEDMNEFIKFVRANKKTKMMAYVIILSLFDITPMNNLIKMVDELLTILPEMQVQTDDVKGDINDAYLSQGEILEKISGEYGKILLETKLGPVEYQCVRFTDHVSQEKVLENMWTLFPNFRDDIVNWMLNYSRSSDRFFFDQISTAMIKLIQIDFGYGIEHILNKMQSDNAYMELLYNVIHPLFSSAAHKDYIDKLIQKWIGYTHSYLWIIPYIMYINDIEGNYTVKVENEIFNIINKLTKNIESPKCYDIIDFIGMHAAYSDKLFESVISVIVKIDAKQPSEKYSLSLIFCSIVSYSYYAVNEKYPKLAFISSVRNEQINQYNSILKYIMSTYDLRSFLFDTLELYLIDSEILHVKADALKNFFLHIAFCGQDTYKDVLAFLDNLKNEHKIARILYDYIDKINKIAIAARKK